MPNFLGYHGFTGTICASINDEIVHGIPNPDRGAGRGRQHLHRLRRDPAGLAQRLRRHGDGGGALRRGRRAAGRDGALDVGRAGPGDRRRPAHRHQRRRRADDHRRDAPVRDRRPLRRARHRHRDAPGPARAQLRPPRPRPQARARPGAGHRADGHRRATRPPSSSRTAGPSSPRTARGPRTSSTPWPSRPRARGSSPPRTAASPAWPRSGSPPAAEPQARRAPVPHGGRVGGGPEPPGYSGRWRSRRPVVVLWPHDPGRPRESVCTTCSAITECVRRGSPVGAGGHQHHRVRERV